MSKELTQDGHSALPNIPNDGNISGGPAEPREVGVQIGDLSADVSSAPAQSRIFSTVFSPRVIVKASSEVEKACEANHLTFRELLSPFCALSSSLAVRDPNGVVHQLPHFQIKLDDAEVSACVVPHDELSRAQAHILRRDKRGGEQLPPVASPLLRQKLKDMDRFTPWFGRYRDDFLEQMPLSEHETFRHPVALIVAVGTSQTSDPIAEAVQLAGEHTLPADFAKYVMDTNILRIFVLVHDTQQCTTTDADVLFARMKKQFGLHCHLLRINGQLASEGTKLQNQATLSSLFAPFVRQLPKVPPKVESHQRTDSQISVTDSINSNVDDGSLSSTISSEQPVYGAMLNDLDIEGIRNCMTDIITQGVIPNMERSIQNWNEQVANGRRGISGRFLTVSKKYFSSTGKSSNAQIVYTPVPGGGASETSSVYPVGTPEYTLRRLADCAVMLRDYKFALNIYDMIRKDFQTEKAWKYYAGAQEMFALCSLIVDPGKDVDIYFEQACALYSTRCKVPAFAIRATLLQYEALKLSGRWHDAANPLMRCSSDLEDDFLGALLLEQAALCFLKGAEARTRKYAFYMVLAGHRYIRCKQRKHAIRNYVAALEIHEHCGWQEALEHIQNQLRMLKWVPPASVAVGVA